jgi:hypothetical protein
MGQGSPTEALESIGRGSPSNLAIVTAFCGESVFIKDISPTCSSPLHDVATAETLSFLSCVEPKAIPESLLPPSPSEEAIVYALGTLDGYAFLARREGTAVFDMHSLVHLAARIWVRGDRGATRVVKNALKHVKNVFPSSDYVERDR